MSLISTSLSQLGASEASVTSPQPDHRASASFSSANPASLHWNEEVSSLELFNDSTMPSFPILTDSKDVEDGLKKVAEPDEDSFQRYGGQLEEFARLEKLHTTGSALKTDRPPSKLLQLPEETVVDIIVISVEKQLPRQRSNGLLYALLLFVVLYSSVN
ncbi:hypothetical protein Pst134EA_011300 [Puccinia striiformis f. sp. tritici]|uniref:hypothetical protein n=1 Tax=Puccinia striiformis f. sp. tritici TaxID=168172 RepID=UPI002008B49C|nr:hypothetical protein Pst134EA_011300 [Puccinia striiformis f. sp. tritici]KAH9467664.1 hypothetical protein Pst134EA_011300 [Puccinia striiformis f. sp. tritici]